MKGNKLHPIKIIPLVFSNILVFLSSQMAQNTAIIAHLSGTNFFFLPPKKNGSFTSVRSPIGWSHPAHIMFSKFQRAKAIRLQKQMSRTLCFFFAHNTPKRGEKNIGSSPLNQITSIYIPMCNNPN